MMKISMPGYNLYSMINLKSINPLPGNDIILSVRYIHNKHFFFQVEPPQAPPLAVTLFQNYTHSSSSNYIDTKIPKPAARKPPATWTIPPDPELDTALDEAADELLLLLLAPLTVDVGVLFVIACCDGVDVGVYLIPE
jgi:hypothetical protein